MGLSPALQGESAPNARFPRMIDHRLSEIELGYGGRSAKTKSLKPLTSTCAPSSADVVEYSEKKIMLRVQRFMSTGTLVQLHLDGNFTLF
jgi:hypothetical protein